MQRFYFSGIRLWYVCLALFLIGVSTVVCSQKAKGQSTCEVERPNIMNRMVGQWEVDWTYRVAIGEYENSVATSVIESALTGCVLTEDFNGTLRGEPFARLSLISHEPDGSVKEIHIDSQHRSFSESQGRASADSLTFNWTRDMGNRLLRRRTYYQLSNPDQFTSRAYLSMSEDRPWELVEEASYSRVAEK